MTITVKKPLFAVLLVLLLVGSFLGGTWYSRQGAGKNERNQEGRKILYYVDPMNPAHTSDKPGPAPCGMDMEPVYADDEMTGPGNPSPSIPPGAARITPERQQMIGVRIEKVERTSQKHSLRTIGRVAADENRTYRVLAGAEGWVWDVHESTTGSLVKKDQLMATVYNYQFLTRQQQYLYALEFEERKQKQKVKAQASNPQPLDTQYPTGQQPKNQQSGSQQYTAPLEAHIMVPTTPGAGMDMSGGAVYTIRDQLEIARLELYSIGVGDYQIQEIARTRRVASNIEVRSPATGIVLSRNVSPQQRFDRGAELFRVGDLSRVWIVADVYEAEAKYIKPGMIAKVSLPHQGKVFQARVTDAPPQFDTATRTLKVRLETDNPGNLLRPEMIMDVDFLIDFPPAIAVPADAVLDSGLKRTVFVDLGNGLFEPRIVETGWRFGERVEIIGGLMPGERIVTSGNFLIDSESRMKLAAEGFTKTPEKNLQKKEVLEKDPMSGMEVNPDKAKREGLNVVFEGKEYYFCSEVTKAQFEKMHGLRVENPSPHPSPQRGEGIIVAPSPQRREGIIFNPSPLRGEGKGEGFLQMPKGFLKDPVCGMPLYEKKAKETGLKSNYVGTTYYFCSNWCKDHFDKEPKQYLNNNGKMAAGAGLQQVNVKFGRRSRP